MEAEKCSPAKLEANRRNALKSTGPQSANGKRNVRLNALKHGLLAKETVITTGEFQEDRRAFDDAREDFVQHYQPSGPVEEMLVDRIVNCYWRLSRAARAERGQIAIQTTDTIAWERKYPKRPSTEENNQLLVAVLSIPEQRAQSNLLAYENSIERQLYRALNQLERIQRQRLGELIPAPAALDVTVDH